MFEPKYIKQGRLLLKGVRKFLRYKRDLIPAARLAEIEEERAKFAEAVAAGDEAAIESRRERLTELCENSVTAVDMPSLRENLEVIFVAVVIAIGIRSYFLQPFKIPTGSMEPTLNGIIGHRIDSAEEIPGAIRRWTEFVVLGRNYVDEVAPRDDVVTGIHEVTRGRFFTFTVLEMRSGDSISIYAPFKVALDDLGLRENLGMVEHATTSQPIIPGIEYPVREGQRLALGFVDTGDQVLVDKVSYNFRAPERGEVFVFNTDGIRGIEASGSFDPQQGSQHYIKRLAGVPGDHLEIRQPALYINGELASEPGFVRVMKDREAGYQGYEDPTLRMPGGGPLEIREIKLESEWWKFLGDTRGRADLWIADTGKADSPEDDWYFALGDNSFSSFDSRAWGPVPEKNLVGPALLVYWPFSSHWGLIE